MCAGLRWWCGGAAVVVVVVVPDVVVHWWAGQTEYTHTLPSPSHSLIKSCHLDTAFGRGGSRGVILPLVTSRRRCVGVGRQRRPTTSLLIHRRPGSHQKHPLSWLHTYPSHILLGSLLHAWPEVGIGNTVGWHQHAG